MPLYVLPEQVTSLMLLHSHLSTSYLCISFPLAKGEKRLLAVITTYYHLIWRIIFAI